MKGGAVDLVKVRRYGQRVLVKELWRDMELFLRSNPNEARRLAGLLRFKPGQPGSGKTGRR